MVQSVLNPPVPFNRSAIPIANPAPEHMSFQTFNHPIIVPRRPGVLDRAPLQPFNSNRYRHLSPPTPYSPSAHAEQTMETDEMDIDPPPVGAPVNTSSSYSTIQDTSSNHSATSTTSRYYSTIQTVQRRPGIYRHIFEIDLFNRHGEMNDHQILQYALLQLQYLLQADMAENAMRRIRNCRMRLRIEIDTRNASRADAVFDIRLRMLVMQDMITGTEGLGWFPGLPWRHPHFVVEILYL